MRVYLRRFKQMDKYLNIVSFNIPYPANYGGVIDVYYKLEALRACGVKLILHCFEYERPHAPELESICDKVFYYKRRTGVIANLTWLPYNVYSRKDHRLIENLLQNDYPILFEGLHSCYYMDDPRLRNRMKIFRECNIEHDYYRHLAKSGKGLVRNAFFKIEAMRFQAYQKVARYANLIIAVSTTDADYLRKQFPNQRIEFVPCFHENNRITAEPGKSDYILYHGKLSVIENERAVLFLTKHVFSQLKHTCIIAGMNPTRLIREAAAPYPHIKVEANPSKERMDALIHNAQIHMLITFQDTGLKLKLLNSLFAGRHTIVNHLMLAGSGLDPLCHIADTPDEMIRACEQLMALPIDKEAIDKRKQLLFPAFSNEDQGIRLYKMIYDERLKAIDYNKLPISDYNKRYIGNLKPALSYFMHIYADCLQRGLQAIQTPISDVTLIDYGGGTGFLSILAKSIGIGQVIYIDLNPSSVETIQLLKQIIGIGPDIILHGDSDVLADWCARNKVYPQLLIATDLIEHVYDLSLFFKDLIHINDSMYLLFTTASTPFNPYVQQRLHKMMVGCESGSLESPNYYTLREQFITKLCPAFSPKEVETWARQTRGLTYPDIQKAIEKKSLPSPEDPYNTCDPATGNWAERILPIQTYEDLLAPYQFKLKVEKGFYNADRSNPVLSLICKSINALIRNSGSFGFLLAPFIILSCGKERADAI